MKPSAIKVSQTLRDYVSKHQNIPDISFEPTEMFPVNPDILYIAKKDMTDAYFIMEVSDHPKGLKFWVAPNFNPERIPDAPHEEPFVMKEVSENNFQIVFPDTGIKPENFFGQYTSTIQEAISVCRDWRDGKSEIPKDYNKPKKLY